MSMNLLSDFYAAMISFNWPQVERLGRDLIRTDAATLETEPKVRGKVFAGVAMAIAQNGGDSKLAAEHGKRAIEAILALPEVELRTPRPMDWSFYFDMAINPFLRYVGSTQGTPAYIEHNRSLGAWTAAAVNHWPDSGGFDKSFDRLASIVRSEMQRLGL